MKPKCEWCGKQCNEWELTYFPCPVCDDIRYGLNVCENCERHANNPTGAECPSCAEPEYGTME